MTNEQMAALAKTLVDAAAQKKLTLRVLCGTAIFMTCPCIETHPALQRKLGDYLDFVAPRKYWDALAGIFATHGLAIRTKETAHWILEKDGVTVDLCDPKFNHADLAARLALASPTVPLADLLLIKLQRTPFVEKHIQDSIALLLDHRVVREAEDQINHEYIGKLCAGNWRLFTTVYDNTVTLEKILDKYLEPEEAQLVWRRIELLQADMDQQPKSFGWMVNQFLRRPTEVPR